MCILIGWLWPCLCCFLRCCRLLLLLLLALLDLLAVTASGGRVAGAALRMAALPSDKPALLLSLLLSLLLLSVLLCWCVGVGVERSSCGFSMTIKGSPSLSPSPLRWLWSVATWPSTILATCCGVAGVAAMVCTCTVLFVLRYGWCYCVASCTVALG